MKKEMENFELIFKEAMSSEVVPMDEIMAYVASAKGKRLRPTLVFLSAKLFGEINETTRRTALFVEMLHTATLIHDDVVDASSTRRGQPSVNARWDNKTAVLAGDYLLSKAMLLLAEPSDSNILAEMLSTAMEMSEGELMQSEELGVRSMGLLTPKAHSSLLTPNSSLYLGVIRRKTAALMRACCVGGALAGMGNGEWRTENGERKIEMVEAFGVNYGLAFQMRDDIMDDDDPEITAIAKKLLPEYVDKAYKALDAMEPWVKDAEALEELRSMVAKL